jgi:hypothetical protein
MTDDRNPMQANGPDPAEDAPAVDPLDERLSAELDGAAAPDPTGTDPTGTEASGDDDEQVDDVHTDGRRRELASARDLLSIPPPPLDDVTRRRLLRAALSEAPGARRRDLHALNRVGVAAAVLAVVVAGGLTLKALTHSPNGVRTAAKSEADKSASATTNAATGTKRDFGEISDPQVLKRRVEASLKGAQAPTTGAPGNASTTVPRPTDSETSNLASRFALGKCDATIRVPAGATPTVLGDGTFDGVPATIIVAHDGGRTLIYVVARSDCRLLTSQFFGD